MQFLAIIMLALAVNVAGKDIASAIRTAQINVIIKAAEGPDESAAPSVAPSANQKKET